MKWVTNLIILAGASALAACASQAPAPSSAAAASPVTAAATTSAVAQTGKFKIPYGYKRVTMNGEDRYCRYDAVTGSRTEKVEVCLTLAELENQQNNTQQFMDQIQRTGGILPNGAGTPGSGGAMGGH